MKMLLVTSDFPPIVSGISTYYYNLFKYFPRDSVVVLAPWVEGCEEVDRQAPFKVYRKRCATGSSLSAKIRRLIVLDLAAVGIIFRERIRLLNSGQVVSSGVLAWLLGKVLGLPYVVYLHGGDGETLRRFKLVNKWIRAIINSSAATITNSDSTRREFIGIGGNARIMHVVNPSVDPEVYRPGIDATRVIQKHKLAGRKVILTVARLGAIKGHDRIIGALPLVRQRVPNVVYLIVGSGPERGRLERMVRDLKVEDAVVFAGFIPDPELPEYYSACDVFAMTSIEVKNQDVEGFGIVYLEASASGKPVVGSRTGGISEAVLDGVSGLLVNAESTANVAEALVRILNDEEFAGRLGRQGRERVEREFSWERSATKLAGVLGAIGHGKSCGCLVRTQEVD